MTILALRSLRHRTTASTATFLAVLLGTALMGSFATLLETATGPVSDADAETLRIMGGVVGGWGTVIVLFSVASTVGITVTQRAAEVGLLRTVGATPRQVRRLVRVETLAVALVASVVGAGVAWLGGRALLRALVAGDVVDSVDFRGGPPSLGLTALVVVLVSLLAASVAGRRATRGPAGLTLRESASGTGRMPWWRVLIGLGLVGYGVATGVVTIAVTRHADDPYQAMATSGSSSILVGVGLAVLAPWLLRRLAVPLRPLLGGTASGHLATWNATRRAHLLGSVLAPVIVLTAGAVGTLMLVGIDHRTMAGAAAADVEAGRTVNLLNYVVTGMISLFAAIMVVNAFAAVVTHRRAELRRLWLVGATPGQAERSVVIEAGIVAAVGVVLGLLASLATIVPFAVARNEGVVPDGELWLPPAIAAAVTVLTLASARGAVRRALRPLGTGR
jgi:putative ABC transport system permease protein